MKFLIILIMIDFSRLDIRLPPYASIFFVWGSLFSLLAETEYNNIILPPEIRTLYGERMFSHLM